MRFRQSAFTIDNGCLLRFAQRRRPWSGSDEAVRSLDALLDGPPGTRPLGLPEAPWQPTLREAGGEDCPSHRPSAAPAAGPPA